VCAVEYVKESGDGLNIAVVQAGADLFMRTCYCPANFPLRVSGHNQGDGKRLVAAAHAGNGHTANGHANGVKGNVRGHVRAAANVTIAGPLCFGGDKIAEELDLPALQEGDFVVVHDAGANTLSTFSRYAAPLCCCGVHCGCAYCPAASEWRELTVARVFPLCAY